MPTVVRPAVDAGHPTRCVIVFFPGFGDGERVFVEHGFIDALAARRLRVDTVSAGATFGYYANRSLLVRLREDVWRPLREKEYKEIWLVGISMGGLGAVLLARDQDPRVAGFVLFAPYLGDDGVLREINEAGGLTLWQPGPAPRDDDREVWRYLKTVTERPDRSPAIYLGAGDDDPHRTVAPHPLAEVLPVNHLFHVAGGHDWGPWSVLWADFLDRSDFAQHCGPPAT